MQILKRIDKYFIVEVFSLTFMIMAAVSTLVFFLMLPGKLSFILSTNNFLFTFFMIFVFLFPTIYKLTVPVSLLLASTLITYRASHDREMEVWFSSGISVVRIAIPLVLLGLLAFISSLAMTLYLGPYANKEFEKFRYLQASELIESIVQNKIRSETFLENVLAANNSKFVLYFDKVSSVGESFEGAFISSTPEETDKSISIFAKKGYFKKMKTQGIIDYSLILQDGELLFSDIFANKNNKKILYKNFGIEGLSLRDSELDWTRVKFSELNFSLVNFFQKYFKPFDSTYKDIRSSYPMGVLNHIKNVTEKSDWRSDRSFIRDYCFFLEKFVLAFACIIFPFIGVCLGSVDVRNKQFSSIFSLSLIAFMFYAIVLYTSYLAMKGYIHPIISIITSPIFLILVTILLVHWKYRYPPSVNFKDYLKWTFKRFFSRKDSK
jgi:lipopolysaccharide export LptBFGC system permease protein LptF